MRNPRLLGRDLATGQSVMDRQTLRDWVRRYNEFRADGFKSARTTGRRPSPNSAQKAKLLALVVKGPNFEKDCVVRWRCVDLRDEVQRHFDVTVITPPPPAAGDRLPPLPPGPPRGCPGSAGGFPAFPVLRRAPRRR